MNDLGTGTDALRYLGERESRKGSDPVGGSDPPTTSLRTNYKSQLEKSH